MKFLICGIGSIGLRHLRNLRQLGYNDIIIYSTGKSKITDAIEETKDLKKFTSLDAALAEKPDICMITNPTALHVKTAIKAANASCHLYIEKPISNNLENLEILKSIVLEKKLISFVTYQFRFHPHIQLLRSIFQNKKLPYGKPLYVTTEWSEYLPDWHPWENYKQGYSARSDLGGGVLLTQVHPLNYLNFLFGKIKNVHINKTATNTLDIDVDDVADLLIQFDNGISGHIHVDYLQKPRVHTMKIVTSNGRFEWDYHKNTLIFINMDGKIETFNNSDFKRNDMFICMLKEFIYCVEHNEKTQFDIENAISELQQIL